MKSQSASLFRPGENCWRIAQANRLSVLVDAQAYFSAFLSALNQARESVIILAWDIDTRVSLVPERGKRRDATLGWAILRALARNPGLHIHILCWEFAMIYSLERQLFPQLRAAFRHPRVHLFFDGRHPFGASQHQKIVIIDDRLAFVGGLDLCSRRWDTRQHKAEDRRRVDPAGKPYRPFHDIQVVLDGEAATALAEVARERWLQATGEIIPEAPRARQAWPEGTRPDFRDLPVAIARSRWATRDLPEVREIEKLYLDSIRSAKKSVYIENQYFTSDRVADAIAERLQDPGSPEFVIAIPRYNSGWVEQSTMGILRLRVIRRLEKVDRFGRLRFYYPVSVSNREIPVNLHSKIMIVDEELLHTGSSNLSNRSMGLDSECDIAIEARQNPALAEAIRSLRNSLIAEHLGVRFHDFQQWNLETGSLFRAIDRAKLVQMRKHDLVEFDIELEPLVDRVTPGAEILDPTHPVEEDPFFSQFVPKRRGAFVRQRYRRLKQRLVAALLIGSLLTIPSIRLRLDPAGWIDSIRDLTYQLPFPLGSVLYFTVGSLLLIPGDLLIFAASLAYGPFLGWMASLIGLMAAGFIFYLAGRFTRGSVTSGIAGGIWSHFLINASMLSHFCRMTFHAGRIASNVSRFAAGTLLGQAFRVATISAYAVAFEVFIRWPHPMTAALLALVGLSIISLFRWASRRFLPNYFDEVVQLAQVLRVAPRPRTGEGGMKAG